MRNHLRISPMMALAASMVVAVIAGTIWRLAYGIDFTDEAWYVAVPTHFIDGGRPFLDEAIPQQVPTAILEYPLLRAYDALAGLTGIVLYVRWLQLLFSIAVAGVVTVALTRSLGACRAAVVALIAVLFVPYDIHSLSYNTVGCGLLTMALLLGYRAIQSDQARRLIPAAVCGGFAVFTYPALLPAIAVAAGGWAYLGPPRGSRSAAAVALLVPLTGFVVAALAVGAGHVVDDYLTAPKYTGEAGSVGKLATIASNWLTSVLPTGPFTIDSGLQIVSHYGWVALVLLPMVRRRQEARSLMMLVWGPALVAGIGTAYTSANGELAFAIGFLPAAIASGVLLVWVLEDAGLGAIFTTIPGVVVIVVLAVAGLSVYRDSTIGNLTVTATAGPFDGLATTPGRRAFINSIGTAVGRLPATCTILFFDDFPAGYLMSSATPDTDSVWTFTVPSRRLASYRRDLIRYWHARHLPDVAVELRGVPGFGPERYLATDPLLAVLHSSYRLVARRATYLMFDRKGTSCSPARGASRVANPIRARSTNQIR